MCEQPQNVGVTVGERSFSSPIGAIPLPELSAVTRIDGGSEDSHPMKTIPLSQGKVALVDDGDFERLSKFNWWPLKDKNNCSQNRLNGKDQGNHTGYKGVFFDGRGKPKPFWARLRILGRTFQSGYFRTAREAAQAYNDMALKHCGEYARLNVL